MKILLLVLSLLTLACAAHAEQKPSHDIPYLKPGAAIRILAPQSLKLEPFSNKQVNIALSTPSKGYLEITHKAEPGITIRDIDETLQYNLNTQTQPSLAMTVASGEPGAYKLMFHAKHHDDGQSTMRVFGLMVYVGDQPALRRKPHPKHIVMPAKETTR